MATSLFERVGGEAAVDAAVECFYGKILADPRVKDYFKSTDMEKQRRHQKRFMTFAFGGPNNYSGRSMKAAHANKGIDEAAFQAVAEDLQAALKEVGLADDLVAEVMTIVASVHDDVISVPTPADPSVGR